MSGTYRHGHFVWRELHTPDPPKSLAFLGEVLGYRSQPVPMPGGGTYNMLSIGGKPAGGLMRSPLEGVPPAWSLCVSVADVDASLAKALDAGGKVLAPPMDVEGMGRYGTIADPTGGVVSVWRASHGDGDRPDGARPGIGEFCWEQLAATDIAKATPFYEKVFGWTQRPFDGDPSMMTFVAGAAPIASIVPAPSGVPTHWLTYVVVDSLAGAQRRAKSHGGKVLVERIDVPNVGPIGVIEDNVGAVLGLFGAAP